MAFFHCATTLIWVTLKFPCQAIPIESPPSRYYCWYLETAVFKERGFLWTLSVWKVHANDWSVIIFKGMLACLTSLVAQKVKSLPTMRKTQVWSLSQEDSLEKEMAIHSSILENPTDGEPWRATVHGVAKSWSRLTNTFTLACLKVLGFVGRVSCVFNPLLYWLWQMAYSGPQRCTSKKGKNSHWEAWLRISNIKNLTWRRVLGWASQENSRQKWRSIFYILHFSFELLGQWV